MSMFREHMRALKAKLSVSALMKFSRIFVDNLVCYRVIVSKVTLTSLRMDGRQRMWTRTPA